MRFCELFKVSPFEYDELPRKLVLNWLHMKGIENQIKESKNGSK